MTKMGNTGEQRRSSMLLILCSEWTKRWHPQFKKKPKVCLNVNSENLANLFPKLREPDVARRLLMRQQRNKMGKGAWSASLFPVKLNRIYTFVLGVVSFIHIRSC